MYLLRKILFAYFFVFKPIIKAYFLGVIFNDILGHIIVQIQIILCNSKSVHWLIIFILK